MRNLKHPSVRTHRKENNLGQEKEEYSLFFGDFGLFQAIRDDWKLTFHGWKKNGSNSSMLKSVAIKRRESYFVVLQVSLHWHLPSKLLCVHYEKRSSLLLAKVQMTDSSTSHPINLLLWIARKKATRQRPWDQHLFLGNKFLRPGYKPKVCDLTTSVVLFTIRSSLVKEFKVGLKFN